MNRIYSDTRSPSIGMLNQCMLLKWRNTQHALYCSWNLYVSCKYSVSFSERLQIAADNTTLLIKIFIL